MCRAARFAHHVHIEAGRHDEPAAGRVDIAHLRRQRAAVQHRLDEMRDLVTAIDRALEREMNDEPATTDDLKELFGDGFEDAQAEAEQRWGDSDAWQQSQQRTKHYTKADWEQVKAESDALHRGFTDAMDAGEPPTSVQATLAARIFMAGWLLIGIGIFVYSIAPSSASRRRRKRPGQGGADGLQAE